MTVVGGAQPDLFGTEGLLPEGLCFEPGFLSLAEERALLDVAAALPIEPARYRGYTARRRVFAWGGLHDDGQDYARPAGTLDELPEPLRALRERIGGWAGVAPADFAHVMVSEYRPGTPLGWHRDAPQYELVAGVSLGSTARMRLRPWPPAKKTPILELALTPRSAYVFRGTARWGWQHSLPPVPSLRWSVTLRTVRARVDEGPLPS
jgi:alkylated DNA repair dioxygenase AlkB